MDIVYVEKYYDQIKERFPELSEKQIDGICKEGLKTMYRFAQQGCDFSFYTNYYRAYFGKLFKEKFDQIKYNSFKHALKYRLRYKLNKTPGDERYYFGFSKEEYEHYKSVKGKEPYFLTRKFVYKLPEECELYNPDYVMEFQYKNVGFKKFVESQKLRWCRPVRRKLGYHKFEDVEKNIRVGNKCRFVYEPVSKGKKKHAPKRHK